MHEDFKTFRPANFNTLTSYLFTEEPQLLIDFVKSTFHAEELSRTLDDSGQVIRNCILKIGDTCFMVAQANGPFMKMRTAMYLYVADPDAMHQRALQNGATEVFPPEDMDYGDRQGGIEDPVGNYWWISKRLVTEDY